MTTTQLIKILLSVSFLFSSCTVTEVPALTNEEIIKETKICHDSGLIASPVRSVISAHIFRIECVPKN